MVMIVIYFFPNLYFKSHNYSISLQNIHQCAQGATPPTTTPSAPPAAQYPPDNSLAPLPLKRELAEKVEIFTIIFRMR